MIAPEQDRLTQLLGELAARADGSNPADRLAHVHGRARRRTQVRVVAAAAAAALVVAGASVLLTRTGSVATPAPPGTTPTTTPSVTPPQKTTTPSSHPTSRGALVPADSQYPAAGACPFVTGAVVTVAANPDVPSPRCVSLTADQKLRIVNNSTLLGSPAVTITVFWANFPPRTLAAGQATTFDKPVGSYLAVGVHRAALPPLYGGGAAAEVWLH